MIINYKHTQSQRQFVSFKQVIVLESEWFIELGVINMTEYSARHDCIKASIIIPNAKVDFKVSFVQKSVPTQPTTVHLCNTTSTLVGIESFCRFFGNIHSSSQAPAQLTLQVSKSNIQCWSRTWGYCFAPKYGRWMNGLCYVTTSTQVVYVISRLFDLMVHRYHIEGSVLYLECKYFYESRWKRVRLILN